MADKTDIEVLQKAFPKGSTAFTNVVHVSRSGMYRHISVHKPHIENGEAVCMQNYSAYIARVLGRSFKAKNYAVGVGGCGMDMGFELIYNLSAKLYGDGYAIKQEWI